MTSDHGRPGGSPLMNHDSSHLSLGLSALLAASVCLVALAFPPVPVDRDYRPLPGTLPPPDFSSWFSPAQNRHDLSQSGSSQHR